MEFKGIRFWRNGKWESLCPLERFQILLSGPQGERWLSFREVYLLVTPDLASKKNEPAPNRRDHKARDDCDSDCLMADAPEHIKGATRKNEKKIQKGAALAASMSQIRYSDDSQVFATSWSPYYSYPSLHDAKFRSVSGGLSGDYARFPAVRLEPVLKGRFQVKFTLYQSSWFGLASLDLPPHGFPGCLPGGWMICTDGRLFHDGKHRCIAPGSSFGLETTCVGNIKKKALYVTTPQGWQRYTLEGLPDECYFVFAMAEGGVHVGELNIMKEKSACVPKAATAPAVAMDLVQSSSFSHSAVDSQQVQVQSMMQLDRKEQQRAQEFMLTKLSMDEGIYPTLLALQKKVKDRSCYYRDPERSCWRFLTSPPSIENDLKVLQLQTFGFYGLLDKNRTDQEYLAKVSQYWREWINLSEERKNPLDELRPVLTQISRMLEKVPDQPPMLPVLEGKTSSLGKRKTVPEKGFDDAVQAFVNSSETVYAASEGMEAEPDGGIKTIKEQWKPPSDQETASKFQQPDLR